MTLQITKMRIRSPNPVSAELATSAKIGFDRNLLLASLILALILIWPLLVFGRPAYYEDTLSYYKGGNAALSAVAEKLTPTRLSTAVIAGAAPAAAIAGTKGARSISYSIVTAALAGPQSKLIPLAMLQALLLSFDVTVLLLAGGVGRKKFCAAALMLAVATPAAWFACFASPDIFAGITILTIAALAVYGARLANPVIAALILIGAFAITAHSGNLALAMAMIMLAWICSRRLRERVLGDRTLLLLITTPILLGVAIVMIGGLVGFGELSLAPKRYPLTLARSIDGGAARPYLQEACPVRHYQVCDMYGDRIPAGGDFLWGDDGIAKRATPTQMERLRAEEWEIVARAALRYPGIELSQAVRGFARQLTAFGLTGISFDHRLSVSNGVELVRDPRAPSTMITVLDTLIYAVAIIALGWLAMRYRSMSAGQRSLVKYVIGGVILNAAICAYFSAVADRYGARVIWLLPLVAIAATVKSPRENVG